MGLIPEFLEGLRRRLTPECDRAVVRSAFLLATAGATGARGPDGRRASVLTPSGQPFEASVTGGKGRVTPELRYAAEAGTGLRFFAQRLAAQRAALDELVGLLPSRVQPAGPELRAFMEALFPDAARVRARTRFATQFGVVHRPEEPSHLARLKLYGNVTLEEGVLARLGEGWPQFAELAARASGLQSLVPHVAALEVDASGERSHKLYLRCRLGFVCCEAGGTYAVQIPTKYLGLEPAALAARHHGSSAGMDALAAAARDEGGRWTHTVVGVGLDPNGDVAKLNVYFAPT